MIQPLADKPSDQSADQWLNHLKKTNANPQLHEKAIFLDGIPALKIKYRNADGRERVCLCGQWFESICDSDFRHSEH